MRIVKFEIFYDEVGEKTDRRKNRFAALESKDLDVVNPKLTKNMNFSSFYRIYERRMKS